MNVLGVVILFCCGTLALAAHGGDSKFCYSCHGISDPSQCSHIAKCWPGGHCGVEVKLVNGQHLFDLDCYDGKHCGHDTPLIGKRERGHHHETVQCRQCCDGENCNRDLCSSYNMMQTTQPTIGVVVGACSDHSEDGFSCNVFDKSVICTETDPTHTSYFLGHTKCPKYCGFCTGSNGLTSAKPIVVSSTAVLSTAATSADPVVIDVSTVDSVTTGVPVSTRVPVSTGVQGSTTVAASVDPMVTGMTDSGTKSSVYVTATSPVVATGVTTSPVCSDIEANGFLCANFDQFNFCTDTTSFAYPLAQEKCQKHCGFCTDDGTTSVTIA